jgi:hypothetical protein
MAVDRLTGQPRSRGDLVDARTRPLPEYPLGGGEDRFDVAPRVGSSLGW